MLVFRVYWNVAKYAVNLFFLDDWVFYDVLRAKLSPWQIFDLQHGPHREGLGLLVVSLLLKLTRWSTRVECFAIASAVVLAMLLALLLKRKLLGPFVYSDVAIPVLFLTLAQWEIFFGGPGPSPQAFPLLLIVLYCLAWLPEAPWMRYGLVVVVNFLLTFTGYGFFMAGITVVLLLIECWRCAGLGHRTQALAAGAGLGGAALTLAAFFHRYTFNAAAGCFSFPYGSLIHYPWFMALMLARFAGIKHNLVLASILGIIALILLIALLFWHFLALFRKCPARTTVVIFSLIGYTLVYATATAVGRICFGIEVADSSRYMTLLIPGLLGCYFYLLTLSPGLRRNLLLGVFVLAVLPGCIQRNHKEIEFVSASRRAWQQCYVRTEEVSLCTASLGLQIYIPGLESQLREKLNYLKQNRLNLYGDARN